MVIKYTSHSSVWVYNSRGMKSQHTVMNIVKLESLLENKNIKSITNFKLYDWFIYWKQQNNRDELHVTIKSLYSILFLSDAEFFISLRLIITFMIN
jgi:hypothetical protein